MPVSVKVGGAWKTATAVFNKVGGVWKTAADMPVKIAGVWKTGILASGAYESIATITAAGGESTLSFTSIPSTYKHLQIRFRAASNYNDVTPTQMRYTYNSNTSSVYTYHELSNNQGTTQASGESTSTMGGEGAFLSILGAGGNAAYTNTFGVGIVDIIDYASTTKYKTTRNFLGIDNNTTAGIVRLKSDLFLSTAAISSVTFRVSGSTFKTGSTFSLYGIKGE